MTPTSVRTKKPLQLFIAVLVCAGLYLVGLAAHRGPEAPPLSAQIPPPEIVDYIWPLYDETQAISESLRIFPVDRNPHDEVARLLMYSEIDEWRGISSVGMSPNSPAWLVGIRGDNLTVGDVMAGHSPGLDTIPNADVAVDGAFYVWDANSGELAGVGVLHNQSDRNYASLASLQHQSLPVMAATALPPYPTYEHSARPTDLWP